LITDNSGHGPRLGVAESHPVAIVFDEGVSAPGPLPRGGDAAVVRDRQLVPCFHHTGAFLRRSTHDMTCGQNDEFSFE
jgi:hypothetical protein